MLLLTLVKIFWAFSVLHRASVSFPGQKCRREGLWWGARHEGWRRGRIQGSYTLRVRNKNLSFSFISFPLSLLFSFLSFLFFSSSLSISFLSVHSPRPLPLPRPLPPPECWCSGRVPSCLETEHIASCVALCLPWSRTPTFVLCFLVFLLLVFCFWDSLVTLAGPECLCTSGWLQSPRELFSLPPEGW